MGHDVFNLRSLVCAPCVLRFEVQYLRNQFTKYWFKINFGFYSTNFLRHLSTLKKKFYERIGYMHVDSLLEEFLEYY